MGITKVRKKDELDHLAEGDPKEVIALMLWRARHHNPELSQQITLKDIHAFRSSCDYMGAVPEVVIVRPEGRLAQEAIPAAGNRRGVAARPAEPPRPYVFVGVVEKGSMNSIKPIESDEDGAQRRDEATAIRRHVERANALSGILIAACQAGTFSTAEITEAAQTLQALARIAAR